jgi:hypothetical protein
MVVDAKAPREGEKAYRFEVLAVKAGASVTVNQFCALPAGEELELALSLRSESLRWVRVGVGVWTDARTFRDLGQHLVPARRGQWRRAVIRFRPPAGAMRLGVFVLFPAEEGGKLTLDAASLRAVR